MRPRQAEGALVPDGVRTTARRIVLLARLPRRTLARLRPVRRRATPAPTLGDRREPPLVVKL